MRKALFIITASVLLLILLSFAVSAEPAKAVYGGVCGDNVTWSFDSDTGVLDFTGTGRMYDYTINLSSYVSDVPWYHYRSSVRTVNFSEGITYIGDSTVYNCKYLKTVRLPSTVTEIGIDCFTSCNSLEAVYIPDLETWLNITFHSFGANPLYLGHDLYIGGTLAEVITVPEGYTSLKPYLFINCTSIKNVILPDSLETVGMYSFIWAKSLETVSFGANLGSIEMYSFFGCDSLTDVYYMGTREAWNSIPKGQNNDPILNAAFHTVCRTHSFSPWYVRTAPTCTGNGKLERRCTVCGHTETQMTDPLGHTFGEWFDYTFDQSKEIRYCSVCGDYETRDKAADNIALEKTKAYGVMLTGLDSGRTYVIRYATGAYQSAGEIKKGTNAGFVQISGAAETEIILPTHGLHTVSVQYGGEQVFIGTVTIEVQDMQKEISAQTDDLNIRIDDLYGANQVRLLQSGSVVMKIGSGGFLTDGLRYRAEFTAPAGGDYILRVIFTDGITLDKSITLTAPSAVVSANGRVFTLSGYGAGRVGYIRFAKGVYTTSAEIKTADGLKTYGEKYFRGDTAAFAALDSVNGETTAYTVQIGYKSGYSEFIGFDITPTVPVITSEGGTVALSNVLSDEYHLDWVRCAPGELSSLYAIRHAPGSQIRKTAEIINGQVKFTGLAPGTYTLFYLYDGWNLSEGMITVTVY